MSASVWTFHVRASDPITVAIEGVGFWTHPGDGSTDIWQFVGTGYQAILFQRELKANNVTVTRFTVSGDTPETLAERKRLQKPDIIDL